MRVHFPDGLSSLLPDLVCVVLHRPVICVTSRMQRCAAASIDTCHTGPRRARSHRLVCGRSHWPARLAGNTCIFIRALFCFFQVCAREFLSIYLYIFIYEMHATVAMCAAVYNYLSCSDQLALSSAAGSPASLTLSRKRTKKKAKCQRPGDGINEMSMSIFRRTSRPLHQQRSGSRGRMRSLYECHLVTCQSRRCCGVVVEMSPLLYSKL